MSALTLSDSYNRDQIEDAYQRWQADPDSVDPTWQAFFAGATFAGNGVGTKLRATAPPIQGDLRLQTGVVRLVNWYRQVGHVQAHIDPLKDQPPAPSELFKLENFGLSEADLDRTVDGGMVYGITVPTTLRDVLNRLKASYCGRVGVEFMYIDDMEKRVWIAERVERGALRAALDRRAKYRTLMTLHQAQHFENYLHTKYQGKKRFSLEGGETLMAMLDAVVNKSPSVGLQEIVLGMAHRGRLNVLVNLLHKPFEQIFNEFEDHYIPEFAEGDGDVKYHMGFSQDIQTPDGGSVHLSLTPNPSHLEIVNPVVEGRVRAKQRLHGDADRSRGMALLIHGDAAFMGQGPVAETLNLANLTGYRTGGTLHVVVNNQIGFTTSPRDARSTRYCTDLAKFIQVPVFHVHGEDPELAVLVSQMALDYRQQFKSDVIIDLVCYRKYGHNEGDAPEQTQPVEYRLIKDKKPVAEVYTEKLIAEKAVEREEADAITEEFRRQLDAALQGVKAGPPKPKKMQGFTNNWKGFSKDYSHDPVDTSIDKSVADKIADQLVRVPEGFKWHPTIKKLADNRHAAIKSGGDLDWGTAEALAFGSLVLEGHLVRLSGQDSRRGDVRPPAQLLLRPGDRQGLLPARPPRPRASAVRRVRQ